MHLLCPVFTFFPPSSSILSKFLNKSNFCIYGYGRGAGYHLDLYNILRKNDNNSYLLLSEICNISYTEILNNYKKLKLRYNNEKYFTLKPLNNGIKTPLGGIIILKY
jgi:hypothetical protein